MDTLKGFWESFLTFLVENDAARIMEILREMDWKETLTNPLAWIVTGSIVLVMIWKKQLKMLVVMCSLVLFLVLLQQTLPSPGQSMELSGVLQFIGGSAILAGVNLYFLFVKQ